MTAAKLATAVTPLVRPIEESEEQTVDRAERRQWTRYQLQESTQIALHLGDQIISAQVEDISRRGMRLSAIGDLQAGSVIELSHPVAGQFQGNCVWRGEDAIGIQLDVPASELERVLQCLCLLLNVKEA